MRGGNDIIGGSTVKGKDGKAISAGNTVTCSGLFGSKTFTVISIDAAKKGAPPSLVNPGNYAAAKCTKVDLNAPVKDTKGFALSVNHDVTCKGLLGSSTFKIQRVDRATGKVFDAKNNGYVAATKCTYQAPGAAVTKKTNGKRSAIKVQIKEADIKFYKTDIERLTGSILLGYTKKDGSMPVQLGGNMNPDGTLEEEGGALKTLTTLSTYILIFKDTIIPTEFETAAAKDIILKSRINVDKQLTPVPSSYAQLISGPSSSGRETAVKIQIKPADLSKFKDDIEKAAGFKILGYTDKSGKNPVQLPQQLGGSLNPDGTFDEQGGALKTVTLLSTYIVIFSGPVNTIAFESKVAANATLKKIMNVDNKTTPVPELFNEMRADPGAPGKETAVSIQITIKNLKANKGEIEKAAGGHTILGYTEKSGKNPVQLPQQLGGSLTPDGTFDEEGGALAMLTTLSTYIVIFNGPVNAIAFASKVAANATLKKIMNVDNKTTPVPESFNKVRAGPGASGKGNETAVSIQITINNLKANKEEIQKEAGHTILGYTEKSGKNPVQLGGSLTPDGTFDEEGGALAMLTTLYTYIVIFNGVVNVTAFASKVAANATLKKIMNVDTKLTDIPASFMKLLSTPPPINTPSNSGSSAPPEEQAAAVDAAASASTAAEAAEAVASTTNDPAIKAAAEAAAAKPGATPASVQRAVQAAASAAPAAAASPTLQEDTHTAVCRLPSGEAGVQPPWEPVKDHPEAVAVEYWKVPSSTKVSATGISDDNIHQARTQIGTKTLYYTFVLIKGGIFGITAAANNKNEAIQLMQPKMNKESGVVKVLTVTGDIENILATEAAEEIEHLIESFEGTIGTLLASPVADSATSAAIQQQVATHKKTIATLKASLAEYKKHAQGGGRRKSRRHYRKKLRSSRRR